MFFIFLYQRYIYKEDKSRVNEFGFSGDMLDEKDGSSQWGEEILAVENKEDEEEEEQSAVTENSQADSSGAWKNTQKQKSKKSKKMD